MPKDDPERKRVLRAEPNSHRLSHHPTSASGLPRDRPGSPVGHTGVRARE